MYTSTIILQYKLMPTLKFNAASQVNQSTNRLYTKDFGYYIPASPVNQFTDRLYTKDLEAEDLFVEEELM
jgi:hypothetical protein